MLGKPWESLKRCMAHGRMLQIAPGRVVKCQIYRNTEIQHIRKAYSMHARRTPARPYTHTPFARSAAFAVL
jgi:hypothetical protein